MDYDLTTDLPFLLTTKREHHKSFWVLLHLTLCKAYVRPSCLYSVLKMDCHKGQRKHPCPLECVTKPSNKITCHGVFPFWDRLYFSQPFVTSNMLLWCFRHIFLMFYTPYNLLCVAKPILLADIIDGARDLAKVNLAERPQFLSPWRLQEHINTPTLTLPHIHTDSHNKNRDLSVSLSETVLIFLLKREKKTYNDLIWILY